MVARIHLVFDGLKLQSIELGKLDLVGAVCRNERRPSPQGIGSSLTAKLLHARQGCFVLWRQDLAEAGGVEQ
jgi:hypothetical protein